MALIEAIIEGIEMTEKPPRDCSDEIATEMIASPKSQSNKYINLETDELQPRWYHKVPINRISVIVILIIFFIVAVIIVILLSNKTSHDQMILEPNPPNWPSAVYVLDASNMSYAQKIINESSTNTQFSDKRYAILFKPGDYTNLDITLSYYVSIIGLGFTPQQVEIGNIICRNHYGTALDNFWRSIENVYSKPTLKWNGDRITTLWAASQAAPVRRVYIDGNLDLWEGAGYSSGGYISNSIINGTITSGSQQQYYVRNIHMSSWNGGAWNMVFQGVENAPDTICPGVYTTIANTPIIAEKPFINILKNGSYQLIIPKTKYNTVGACIDMDQCQHLLIDFSHVYVTNPDIDTADTMNDKFRNGIKYMVISAGIYYLDAAISITSSDIVILGIGFPTLIATNGNAVIEVGINGQDIGNIRIAGLLLEAGAAGDISSEALLQFGAITMHKNEIENVDIMPSFLYDIFVRVGGPSSSNEMQVEAYCMIQINSDNVVIDNAWLWRADHDVSGLVMAGNNFVATGLKVNGDNVTTYGLAVEHTLNDLVQWNGNNGRCYFYQCELAYDVSQEYSDVGYVGFRVGDDVDTFEGYGIGVYSYFRDYNVTMENGVQSPMNKSGVMFTNVFTKYLDGNGGFQHVINDAGGSTSKNTPQPQYVCHYSI